MLLLVDVTTPYDETDRNVIVQLTEKLLAAIRGGDKFIFRTIADSHTRSERLIERCVPHCPESGTVGRLFNCSDGLIRTDSDNVRAEIIKSLRQRLSKFQELKYSDIVRTIYSVSKEEIGADQPVSLHIYSDLIENSDYFSSRRLFSNSTAYLLHAMRYFKLVANLRNADVYVSGVGRAGTEGRPPLDVLRLNKLVEFWTAYFKESGAKSISISHGAATPVK